MQTTLNALVWRTAADGSGRGYDDAAGHGTERGHGGPADLSDPVRETIAGDALPIVVLLHGFGAAAADLMGLAPALRYAAHWIFPDAPVSMQSAGMPDGRAWFPRSPALLRQALSGGYFGNLRSLAHTEVAVAAQLVTALIEGIRTCRQAQPPADRQGFWRRVVLGGFSQGAIVSAETLRQAAADPAAPLPGRALLFSGALIAETTWNATAAHAAAAGPAAAATAAHAAALATPAAGYPTVANPGCPVFQSHGNDDPILPIGEGRALRDSLTAIGYAVQWQQFRGGHSIDDTTIQAAARFLRA